MFNAAADILAHNHLSDLTEPRQTDHLITKKLEEVLSLVDVKILDHFIIDHGKLISFNEHDWL